MRLLHGSNIEIVQPNLMMCQNMEERYIKFEDLMADLAAYLVSEYDFEPRDAAGLVMNSPLTQELYLSEEPITDTKVKALAERFLATTADLLTRPLS